jgi:serine/threonine-protein kinase
VLTSAGGDVRARCTSSGSSKLLAWAPKTGWAVTDVSAGPALATAIVFADDASRVRMTVTCVAGVPTGVTLPL